MVAPFSYRRTEPATEDESNRLPVAFRGSSATVANEPNRGISLPSREKVKKINDLSLEAAGVQPNSPAKHVFRPMGRTRRATRRGPAEPPERAATAARLDASRPKGELPRLEPHERGPRVGSVIKKRRKKMRKHKKKKLLKRQRHKKK